MSRIIGTAGFFLLLIASLCSCSKHLCDPIPAIIPTKTDTETTVPVNPISTVPKITGFTNLSKTDFPSLVAVEFQDSLHGYISGVNGFLQRTTDGGNSWTNISPTAAGDLYGLYFVSHDEGYIGSNNGDIFKTSNGGTNWAKVTTPSNAFGYGSFAFITSDTGYAGGGAPSTVGSLLRTTDRGLTWNNVPIPGLSSVYDIIFVNQSTGFICGMDNQIFKTTDGGKSWTQATVNLSTAASSSILLSKIKFSNSGIGYCVGYAVFLEANFILKSTDNGSTWNQIPSPPQTHSSSDSYTSLFITHTNEVYITGGNITQNTPTLFKSDDEGASWTNVANSATSRLFESCYLNGKSFVVGLNGTILKSVNK